MTAGNSMLIKLDGVSKRFANGTVALQNLSLQIPQGQFVSLLGPSGCGKSTALRMIAGLMPISSGAITVGTHRPGEGSGLRDVGFVFQEPTLMPWATVFDNVYLPLRLRSMSRGDAAPAIGEALAMVGLTKFAGAYPHELSGGMKMRASIARAMVTKPRLLLMDEPFAALDEMTRLKLNDDILRLWRQHDLTVIFVTHSVYESVYISNRVIVMAARPGRAVADIPVVKGSEQAEEFRNSPEYSEHCRNISRTLKGTLHDVDH